MFILAAEKFEYNRKRTHTQSEKNEEPTHVIMTLSL